MDGGRVFILFGQNIVCEVHSRKSAVESVIVLVSLDFYCVHLLCHVEYVVDQLYLLWSAQMLQAKFRQEQIWVQSHEMSFPQILLQAVRDTVRSVLLKYSGVSASFHAENASGSAD